jgi:restriction system protein
MPIPKFHELMLPLLKLYADSQIHHRKEFLEQISDYFKLTEEERSETVKTGITRIWDRVGWAHIFLKTAKMLKSPSRGCFQITERGLQTLKLNLKELNPEVIKELYPDVMETKFWNPELREQKIPDKTEELLESETTPDETLETILEQKKAFVKAEILESIKALNPRQFEILVVKVLLAMGYGTEEFSKATNYTNDGGIDGIIQADELGFDKIYIQAKKYEGSVGRPDIQRFVGAMVGTNKGVFITTSDFASSVNDYLKSRQENISLINGEKLVDLMYKHNQGVSTIQTIDVKRIDTDYFEEL